VAAVRYAGRKEMQSRKWSRVVLLDPNKFGPTAPTGRSNKKEPIPFRGSPSENTQLTSSTRQLPPRADDTGSLDVAIRFGPDRHPWFHSRPGNRSPWVHESARMDGFLQKLFPKIE